VGDTINAIVLFTDVVGSTALSQLVSAERADELRRSHVADLQRAVEDQGGDVVKHLGDGVMAIFDSSTAAMAAAEAMQRSVDLSNRTGEHHVGLRVGLSAGEVSHEEGDYFGDPVVEASRLCAAADAGQILAADLVRQLAGRRVRLEYRPMGELQLRGLPDPVAAIELFWEPAADDDRGVPLPPRLEILPNVGSVVGYRDALGRLDDAFRDVAERAERRLLLVSGEAGQGKSTVVAEAARRAKALGACVLFGHSEEHLAAPYRPFVEAIGHWVRHASESHLREHVAEHGTAVVRLVPELARRLPDISAAGATDAETERFMLFGAVVGLLSQIAHRQPLVLVVDDLQWADEASLQLLEHLSGAEELRGVLVTVTCREGDLAHAAALRGAIGRLRRHEGVDRVQLDGLGDDGVVEFLGVAAGYQLNDEETQLAHSLYRETDGNPFFVHQILRHLLESGTIFQDESGRWVTEGPLLGMPLPDSIRDVVQGRVALLGDDADRVLSVAAVVGRDFDVEVLSSAVGLDDDELVALLAEATVVALVRENRDAPGHFSFAHALIQHTLYESLGPTQRARIHRRVAEALEVVCGATPRDRAAELARHYEAGGRPEDATKAAGYWKLAGDVALAALAPADALGYFEASLAIAGADATTDSEAIDLAIGIGTAQRQVGNPDFAHTLVAAARLAIEHDDRDRLAAAAIANNRGFFSSFGAIDPDKVAVLQSALERLNRDDPRRALVLATYCLEIVVGSPLELRRQLADEALTIARHTDDDAVIVSVLNNVAYPLMVPTLLDLSLERTAEAIARVQHLEDPFLEFFALHWRGQVVCQAGDFAERHERIDTMGRLAARLNQPMLSWVHLIRGVESALIEGDLELAERAATTALEVGTAGGQPDAGFIYGAQLLVVHRMRGALDELASVLTEMASTTPSVAGIISGALAVASMEQSRVEEAAERLAAFVATDTEDTMHPAWIFGLLWHAETAIELGDPAFARPLFEALAPFAGQWASAGAMIESPVNHYLGGLAMVLGRFDDADGFLARSLVQSDEAGARFFASQTELQLGRLNAVRGAAGDEGRARRLLEKARSTAAAAGYRAVERRATEALGTLN
jgi:class 3 adenylate cyclase